MGLKDLGLSGLTISSIKKNPAVSFFLTLIMVTAAEVFHSVVLGLNNY